MTVREATSNDAAAWADVVARATPYLVVSAASVRHEMATATRTAARLVAEAQDDGGVVGVARVRTHGDRTMVMVQVVPEHRRRGVGRALLDAALGWVPAGEVAGIVAGDDASVAAARAWGFVTTGRHTISAVDPRTVTAAHGETVALADVDPRAVWECFAATATDDPSGLSQAHGYEEFLADEWRLPTHRADLGRAVVIDGVVTSFASVTVAGERAWNAFTGTRPEARGQGLAARVKAAALVALAEAGVTRCATGNDAANAPMLAVNARLDYRPFATTYSASRTT